MVNEEYGILYNESDAHSPIKLTHGKTVTLGRTIETGIADKKLSKTQGINFLIWKFLKLLKI